MEVIAAAVETVFRLLMMIKGRRIPSWTFESSRNDREGGWPLWRTGLNANARLPIHIQSSALTLHALVWQGQI